MDSNRKLCFSLAPWAFEAGPRAALSAPSPQVQTRSPPVETPSLRLALALPDGGSALVCGASGTGGSPWAALDWPGRARPATETIRFFICRPEIRRDYPLNLSISLSGGKETNKDSPSNGE